MQSVRNWSSLFVRLGRLRNVIAPNMMLHIYQCISQPIDLIMQLLYDGDSLRN